MQLKNSVVNSNFVTDFIFNHISWTSKHLIAKLAANSRLILQLILSPMMFLAPQKINSKIGHKFKVRDQFCNRFHLQSYFLNLKIFDRQIECKFNFCYHFCNRFYLQWYVLHLKKLDAKSVINSKFATDSVTDFIFNHILKHQNIWS